MYKEIERVKKCDSLRRKHTLVRQECIPVKSFLIKLTP